MGTLTLIMFLAVERQKLILPIKEWTNELGDLLQEAHDNRPQSQFCIASWGRGSGFYDILNICDRFHLKGLNFLDTECSTLEGTELVSAIGSLNLIVDELLNNLNSWYYTKIKNISKESLLKSFEKATVNYDIDWQNGEDAVFSLIKTLIFVINDALTNNKVFLFINYPF